MTESEYLFHAETQQITICSMEVINELGHGFHEKIYENSLVVEFGLQNIPVIQQPEYPVVYKATNVRMNIHRRHRRHRAEHRRLSASICG